MLYLMILGVRISGVMKIDSYWVIFADAEKSYDQRIKIKQVNALIINRLYVIRHGLKI